MAATGTVGATGELEGPGVVRPTTQAAAGEQHAVITGTHQVIIGAQLSRLEQLVEYLKVLYR